MLPRPVPARTASLVARRPPPCAVSTRSASPASLWPWSPRAPSRRATGPRRPPASEPSSAAGTTQATGTSAAAGGAEGLPRPAHVMVAIFENEDLSAIVGSAEAPYLTELAASGANFTDAHGETHPSQPNYLALFSGSTQGVTDDSCPVHLTGRTWPPSCWLPAETFVGLLRGPAPAGLHRVPERRVRAQAQPVGRTSATSPPRSTSRSARCPPTTPTCPPSPSSSPTCATTCTTAASPPATPGSASTSRAYVEWAQDAQQPADRHLRRGQRRPRTTTSPRSSSGRGRGRPAATSASTTTTCCAPWRTCTACRRSARRPAHRPSPGSGRRPDLPGP